MITFRSRAAARGDVQRGRGRAADQRVRAGNRVHGGADPVDRARSAAGLSGGDGERALQVGMPVAVITGPVTRGDTGGGAERGRHWRRLRRVGDHGATGSPRAPAGKCLVDDRLPGHRVRVARGRTRRRSGRLPSGR